MKSVKSTRRELELGIDTLIEEMNSMYGAELQEEEALERKLSDIRLRARLEEILRHIVRFAKIAERRRDEELMNVGYIMSVTIDSEGAEFEVKGRTT